MTTNNGFIQEAPIFVVGPPRSGTTLTARILGSHPEVFIPGETHYMEDIYSRRTKLGDPKKRTVKESIFSRLSTLYGRYDEHEDQERVEDLFKDSSIVKELKEEWCDYTSVLSSFMRLQMREVGKTRWGNQVPKDLFHAYQLNRMYPNARFVACIRDPRDFLVSYRERWKTAPGSVERISSLYHPVVTAAMWRMSSRFIVRLLEDSEVRERVFLVRYEDLVSTPEDTVSNLCRWAGLPFDKSMLYVKLNNSSETNRPAGIYRASLDRWRTELSAEEQFLLAQIVGKESEKLGYNLEEIPHHKLTGLMFYILSTPYAVIRAAYVTRNHREPLWQFITNRIRRGRKSTEAWD